MPNYRMQEKIGTGEAIDVSSYERNGDGDYILPNFIDGKDYCVGTEEIWIFSIGRSHRNKLILAATTAKFGNDPDFECLWLR